MTLISVLVGLLLDRAFPQLHRCRHYLPLQNFADWVQRKGGEFSNGVFGLLLVLLPPVLLVALLQAWLQGGVLNILGFLFSILVLVACLGPRDLPADVNALQESAAAGDPELVARSAQDITGRPAPADEAGLMCQVINSIFAEANNRHFAVLFWFIVLGPLGAVLYRGAEVVHQHTMTDVSEFSDTAWRLLYLLEWLPAHLLALSYALSGHFDGAVEAWGSHRNEGSTLDRDSNRSLVIRTGNGSLGRKSDAPADAAEVDRAMGLVWRAAIVWLVALALLTLAGWST